MQNLKTALGWALGLLSVYMVFNGLIIFDNTTGHVQGSEFGMLITLVNQVALIMIWLALYALRSILPPTEKAAAQPGT